MKIAVGLERAMRTPAAGGVLLVMLAGVCPAYAQLTGIHAAARSGDVAQVKALLDKDAALVNAVESAGWTPLHFAAQQGHQELAELLLTRGADVHAKLKQTGGTPLHVAATTGRAPTVALLLAKGAAANATDHNEWTPLHRAAAGGHREVAELLLAAGANAHAWSNTSVTPIDQATYADFADFLRERGRAALPIADDFSGNCRWPSGENERMWFGCDRGAYRMRLKRPGPNYIPQNFGLNTPAVSTEVDASVTRGRGTEPGNALLGIGCMSDRWHGYMGILRTSGAWAIMRIRRDFAQLAGTNAAGAITGLDRTNRLRIVCARENGKATLVSFFVNGRQVGSAKDEAGYARFYGVVLYTDTFPGEVVFERFAARLPSD